MWKTFRLYENPYNWNEFWIFYRHACKNGHITADLESVKRRFVFRENGYRFAFLGVLCLLFIFHLMRNDVSWLRKRAVVEKYYDKIIWSTSSCSSYNKTIQSDVTNWNNNSVHSRLTNKITEWIINRLWILTQNVP